MTYLLNRDRTHGASYRYDPYGRPIAGSGPLASANLMRFSGKPWHDPSETYYYGYRFYLPEGQRWINRDPIQEEGGINLYTFVLNNPNDRWDGYGHAPMGWPIMPPPSYPASPSPFPASPTPRHMGFSSFSDCMDWCMRMMNPWMLPQATCVATSIFKTGAPAAGSAAAAGWTLGTAAGCAINCL